MEKVVYCECCHRKNYSIIECDTCGKPLPSHHGYTIKEIGNPLPIKLELGTTSYDFCSEECAIIFLTEEWKKRFTKGELDAKIK